MDHRLLKRPYEILPDVYDVTVRRQWGRRYRCYLVDGPTPTLIDTCHDDPDPKGTLLEGLEELGIPPERLFITHGDPDHVGGYDTIVEEYDVETWVPEETVVDVEHEPDHRYGDGDTIGDFEAVNVPGHEDDSYALIDDDASYAIFGDVVVGADIRGLPSGYLTIHGEGVTNDPRAAEQNLTILRDYDFEAALVFHGSSVLEGASEKIEAYVDGPKRSR